jgi:hypothetical protein
LLKKRGEPLYEWSDVKMSFHEFENQDVYLPGAGLAHLVFCEQKRCDFWEQEAMAEHLVTYPLHWKGKIQSVH